MDTQDKWQLADWLRRDLEELEVILNDIHPIGKDHLGSYLLPFNRIFLVGQGRTGLIMRMFAMRLMQLGFSAFIVGDSTTPAIQPGELLIAASGSGETEGVVRTARQAKTVGARLAVITSQPESSLSKLSDQLTIIPGETTKISSTIKSYLPLASTLEQGVLLFLDCQVAWIAMQIGQTNDTMMAKHANLE